MEIQPFTYDSIKTNGWLNGTSLALPHGLGHGWAADAVGHDLGPDRQARVQPEPLRRLEHGRQQPRAPVRDRRPEAAGLRPRPGRRPRRDHRRRRGAQHGAWTTCTLWATFARRGLGYSAVQGTTDRNDNTEAFDTHPDCQRNFQAPVAARAGDQRPVPRAVDVDLRFTHDGYRGLDVLAENQPYSRLVDCTTLETVTPGQTAITPRPYPVKALGALSVDAAASSPSRGRPRPPGPAPAARWWPRPTPAGSTGRTSASPRALRPRARHGLGATPAHHASQRASAAAKASSSRS